MPAPWTISGSANPRVIPEPGPQRPLDDTELADDDPHEDPHDDPHGLAELTHELLVRAASAPEPEKSELRGQAVTNYLWLADRIARRYQGRGEEDDDLQQVARSGLVEAANRYEPRGTSFPAFAVPTITGVVKRHFRDHGWLVRPPRRTQEAASQIGREWPELAQQLGCQPDDEAVARRVGHSIETVRAARLASRGYSATSLDAAMSAGMYVVAEDAQADRDRAEIRIVIAGVWRKISADERRLLTMRFVEERSQSDIAAEIGTSQMQVSRLLSRTLRRMRIMIEGAGAPIEQWNLA